jgi:hypothetical protein
MIATDTTSVGSCRGQTSRLELGGSRSAGILHPVRSDFTGFQLIFTRSSATLGFSYVIPITRFMGIPSDELPRTTAYDLTPSMRLETLGSKEMFFI